MRLIHIADVHLDAPFATRSEVVRERLRQATRDAFERSVTLAIENDVDAFLIAGDLFHGDRTSFQSEALVVEQLTRLATRDVPVVYATGNHDPGLPGSRLLGMSWPANVTLVATAEPQRIAVSDRAGRTIGFVTAAGHETAGETRDLSLLFPSPAGDVAEVALLHTQVSGSSGESAHASYAPSTLEHLESAGFDYWALGHVHLRQALSSRVPIHYPGNPQGQTPREDGAKGCLLVDLTDRRRPDVAFHDLAPVRWVRVGVDDLEGCSNLEAIVDRVEQSWTAARATDAGQLAARDVVLHLVLAGACPIWRTLLMEDERRGLGDSITARLGVIWTDIFPPRVRPVLDLAEHMERPDVLGETLRLVRSVRASRQALPDLDADDLALPHLLEVRDTEAYLGRLLEDAEEDVLARMLRSEVGRSARG